MLTVTPTATLQRIDYTSLTGFSVSVSSSISWHKISSIRSSMVTMPTI